MALAKAERELLEAAIMARDLLNEMGAEPTSDALSIRLGAAITRYREAKR
jgi:hypothetical protein